MSGLIGESEKQSSLSSLIEKDELRKLIVDISSLFDTGMKLIKLF